MSRCLAVVVATMFLTTSADAGPADVQPERLSAVAVSAKPTHDVTVHVHAAKQDPTRQPTRCRLTRDEVAMPQTGGQYTVRPIPDDTAVSMTLIHPLSTPTWVTPMARELARVDDDTVNPDDVDVTLLLASGGRIEFVAVGLEVLPPDDGVVRANTRVRLPRGAIEALAASPVVQVTWSVNGATFPASLSRHQGQRWYQEPFACIALGML